jgi:hypothetical protein
VNYDYHVVARSVFCDEAISPFTRGLLRYRSQRHVGERQRAAGVAVREQGGVAPVRWVDVDAVRVG